MNREPFFVGADIIRPHLNPPLSAASPRTHPKNFYRLYAAGSCCDAPVSAASRRRAPNFSNFYVQQEVAVMLLCLRLRRGRTPRISTVYTQQEVAV